MFLSDEAGRLCWSREDDKGRILSLCSYNPFRLEYSFPYKRQEKKGIIIRTSRWSQLGIRVPTRAGPVSRWTYAARLPVPYAYDFDLRGDWCVTLDVARRMCVADERLSDFKERFYTLITGRLCEILVKEDMLPTTAATCQFVDGLLDRCDPLLRKKLQALLNYSPENSNDQASD